MISLRVINNAEYITINLEAVKEIGIKIKLILNKCLFEEGIISYEIYTKANEVIINGNEAAGGF